MNETFVDSNICIYGFDESNPKKQEIAFAILEQMPVLSSQVLIETYNASFRKLKLDATVCEENISILLDITLLFKMDEKAFCKAFALQHKYYLSFLDALIVASALDAGCNILYSEDMQHGLLVNNSLRIINPFI